MRSRYAGHPFTTSTPEIAAALEDVSIPTLLLSLVHITGDPRFIRDFKQMGIFLNEVQGFMSEEDKARARSEALSVIAEYRDRGCPEPAAAEPRTHQGNDGLGGVRARSRRLPIAGLRGAGPRRRRPPPPGRPCRPSARPSFRSWSSGVANPASWPASASNRPTFRSPSWRRTRAPAEHGGRTAIPEHGWMWPTISIATASNPTTTGHTSSPSSTSCRTISPRS